MNFKKLNPNISNNNYKNKKLQKYQNKYICDDNNIFQEKNHNQSVYENERIIKNYNQKLFMTNENFKESGEILFKKINNNANNLKDNISHKNCSFITEPAQNNYNFTINEKKKNNLNNSENSIDSNNNNSLLKDIDLICNNHNQISNSKNAHKFREKNFNYTEFLQKQFDQEYLNKNENSKTRELDINELFKKYEEIIEDNKLLNLELNERTSKLNKIIQENISLKSQINELKLGAIKNEQKINFYEEQINILKNKDNENQKIINDLKIQNEKMKLNFGEIDNVNKKNSEIDFQNQLKEEIEIIKKNLEEINNQNKNIIDNESNTKIYNDKNLYDEIKNLKEKNEYLNSENELIKKENKNLLNQNNTSKTKIESYINQINDLNEIIKSKDVLINALKEKEKEKENTQLIKSNELKKNNIFSNLIIDNKISENFITLNTNIKKNEMKLDQENKELNEKINELNLKLEDLMNKNKNIIEEMKYKQNEIEKLEKEIEEKDKQNKKYKIENNTKIKEYEINISKYKEDLIEKNKLIKNLQNENEIKEKQIFELSNKKTDKNYSIKKEISINILQNKEIMSKEGNNAEIIKNKEIINDVIKKEEINNLDKKEENNLKLNEKEIEENKIEKKYKTSLRNKFRLKKEEERKNKEKEEKNYNIKLEEFKNNEEKELEKKEIENIININNDKEIKESDNTQEKLNEEEKEEKLNHGNKLEEKKDEVKESIRMMNRKKNYTHKPRFTTKNSNLPNLEGAQNTSSNIDDNKNIESNNKDKYYLYGIDRNDYFHIFDIINKKYEKMKISQIKLDEKSTTFKKDYQYEGTILYNTLKGLYILTGEKVDTLYYFNSLNDTITKICKFNSGHDNGNILYDEKNNNLYVFGGKKIRSCEFYNFEENKLYQMPDLIIDRANSSSIISNGKIFCFFGFSYEKNNYANDIEYIDINTKEKWIELKDIIFKDEITFDMESVAALYYKNKEEEEIMLYNGIKGDDEEFITDYYLIYNTKNNEIKKIKTWETKQFKLFGKKWKNYFLKKTDLQGFHFAKNTKFLSLNNLEGFKDLNILIDYKNNFHFVDFNKEEIEIYRGNI